MKTQLSSGTASVVVDTEGPVTMIGEKINPTGRTRLAAALADGDYGYMVEMAVAQVEAGADVLDINVGVPGIDEVTAMHEVVTAVAEAVDVPLCIDSPNAESVIAGVQACGGRPLVNSVNGEEASLERILPIVKEYDTAVIALTLDEGGIPPTPEGRLAIAGKIIERVDAFGIPLESIIVDPLVMTVGADSNASRVTLDAIAMVTAEFGVNVSLGASNVSFGLPDRHTLNQAFLALAVAAGASCVMTDAARAAPTVRAVDLLRGRDLNSMRYIAHYRKHAQKDA
jgi:5-methyltetrahydrofolate--homocysteine methyltransferase